MLVSIFMFFELILIGLFIASFFTHQEILWALTLLFSGVLMFTSWNVESYIYVYNVTSSAYDPTMVTHSYPYLMGINLVFFVLALVLTIFDLFDKYGARAVNNKEDDDEDKKY